MSFPRAGFVLVMLLFAAPAFAQMAPEADAPPPVVTGDAERAPPARPAAPPQTTPPLTGPLAPRSTEQAFRKMWPNFVADLRRLPSRDTGVVLGTGALLSLLAYNSDAHFTEHASAGGTDQIFAVGGRLGDGFVQAGLSLGVYVMGHAAERPAVQHLGADLIRAHLVTGALTHALKLTTRRTRPNGESESNTKTFSFPSGHSSATWTSATVLWRHLGWKAGVPAAVLAGYASASRLQQNEHYMTDVLFGAALGIASGRTITMGHGGRRLQMAPVPVRGGGAIVFSVLPR
jgi:membrane-associated phospholipid phosphatase